MNVLWRTYDLNDLGPPLAEEKISGYHFSNGVRLRGYDPSTDAPRYRYSQGESVTNDNSGVLFNCQPWSDYRGVWDNNGPPWCDGVAYDTVKPGAPYGGQFTSTSTSISLVWSDASDNVGVVLYEIFRDGLLVGNSTNTRYTDGDLDPARIYEYRVVAIDAAGNRSTGLAIVANTSQGGEDRIPPSRPEGIQVIITQTTATITWNASTDNQGIREYNVYLNGELQSVQTTREYTATGLAPSSNYILSVSAVDLAGNESVHTSYPFTTDGVPDTEPPTAVPWVAAVPSSTQVVVSWGESTDNTGVDRYAVYRDDVLVGYSNGFVYTDNGLSSATQYTYTIVAIDAADNESAGNSVTVVTDGSLVMTLTASGTYSNE